MDPLLVGLVGRNIQQSRAPYLHQTEADAQGRRLAYRLFDTSAMGLDDTGPARILDAAELLGFSGLNITHPYKQQILPLLSDLSDDAKLAGAANTVLFENGRRVGHNTDIYGFERAFARNFESVRRNSCLQVGAGGAGAATAIALLRLGVGKILVHDTDPARASDLVERLSMEFGPECAAVVSGSVHSLREVDGLVNATPVGMGIYPGSPVPLESMSPSLWVVDIIYFPPQTELLRHAESVGCRTMNGADMAVYQAAKAFDLFTGENADRERMLESIHVEINSTGFQVADGIDY